MKKNYTVPTTEIMNVALQHIMAGSPLRINKDGDLEGGTLQEGDAQGVALSRGGFWDDDEE